MRSLANVLKGVSRTVAVCDDWIVWLEDRVDLCNRRQRNKLVNAYSIVQGTVRASFSSVSETLMETGRVCALRVVHWLA